MDNQRVIATLNNLLETTQDGVRGFVACAEGVQNARLKAVFETAARRCEEGAAELTAIVFLAGNRRPRVRSAVRFIGHGRMLFRR
jgi:uncharacterized protein (TIGR02284 family)